MFLINKLHVVYPLFSVIVKDADVLCRDTDTVLYSSELENILQSVTSPSGHHFSYIVSNNLSTVKELQALEAYIYFVNHNGDESTNLWVNFSPCKECTHVLIDTYRRSSSKPIIHFAQLLTDEDNPVKSIIKSIECLVRLEHEGFSVRVWNWSTFRDNYLTVQDCKDDVNNAVTTREFMDAYMTVQYVDSFVHELAMNSGSVAGAWCSL